MKVGREIFNNERMDTRPAQNIVEDFVSFERQNIVEDDMLDYNFFRELF